MKRVLIVDALNQFIRMYITDPSLSVNGDPIGGMKGFLMTIQKIAREVKPDAVVMAWDGPGGSMRRKQTVKEYKDGRAPLRVNRSIDLTQDEQYENRTRQQFKLFEILNTTPIIQLCLESVEADDIISYTCQSERFRDWQKIIVSSDKDFYQLLDDKTILLRPTQKQYVNMNNVIEDFGIHPNNFALARAISGDKSDNLPGIPGVGMKTIAKRFQFLKNEKQYLLDDLIKYSDSLEEKAKVHKVIRENKELVQTNYKMMQLSSPMLNFQDTQKIKYVFDNHVPEFNGTEFQKLAIKEGFPQVNFADLFTTFRRIIKEHKDSA